MNICKRSLVQNIIIFLLIFLILSISVQACELAASPNAGQTSPIISFHNSMFALESNCPQGSPRITQIKKAGATPYHPEWSALQLTGFYFLFCLFFLDKIFLSIRSQKAEPIVSCRSSHAPPAFYKKHILFL